MSNTIQSSNFVTPPTPFSVDNYSTGVGTVLNITAATVIKAAPGRLVRINVVVAGAAGTANDCATVGAVAASNAIAATPAVVGPIWLDWPCATGIVVSPGAAQVLAVSFY